MFVKNDAITTEKRKIIFQYLCVLLFSLILGCVSAYLIKEGMLLSIGEGLRKHFSAPFPKDNIAYNISASVIRYSFPDIICVVGAFCFTFSIVSHLADNVIIFYEGFAVGFSAAVLYRYITVYENLSISKFVWFTGFKISFLIFILSYLCGLAFHYFELKEFTSIHRVKIKIKPFIFLLMYSVVGLGTAILLNTIYCVIVFIL